ncbi:MAG: ferrous iron transporter B [Chloroflexota bacterium]|nr:ferrous iron transporter B [Chloroflexota bacterium]
MAKNITVALAGNPNSGKTTVFNNLTGARQHVGNWPGVTVEKKEGGFGHRGYNINVVDLPGVYSLTAYSPDEVVARNFILKEEPDVVVDIVDASNLERNLYLAVQLLELGAKVIIALNMMDVAESRKYKINVKELSRLMGMPVVPMVASHNKGTEDLRGTIVDVVEGKVPADGAYLEYGKDVEGEISRLEGVIASSPLARRYSPRWLAIKLLERDEEIVGMVKEGAHV